MVVILLFLVGLCWGSFLNVVACHCMQQGSILSIRSRCCRCKQALAWYDLVPLFSWLLLKGSCRYCRVSIVWLYPLIEIVTAIFITALALLVPSTYFFAYFILFSALIIAVRTDMEHMLIARVTSLYMVPVGLLFSVCGMIPISASISAIGALGGYFFLYGIARVFTFCTRKDGLGQGDMELLACIGAFTGPMGCWAALFIGSIAGTCVGLLFMRGTQQTMGGIKIPFGPFLAFGAMLHVLYMYSTIQIFFL
jgi:leader peptidase (prepilin peptidase) / N-methyltransferase